MKNCHLNGFCRLKPLLLVAGLLVVSVAAAQKTVGSQGTSGTTPNIVGYGYPGTPYETAPNHFIVSFAPGTSQTYINSLVQKYGLVVDADHSNKYFTRLVLTAGLLANGVKPEQFINPISKHPTVMYAELDTRITPDYVPNDPRFTQQWHLDNTGQSGGTADADVDAVEGFDDLANIGETVVAVCDDGVDLDHEDLSGTLWVNPGEIPGNSIDDDNNGFVDDINGWDTAANDNDPRPEFGDTHGTHVAGIVNAEQDNNIGVSGVAPKAKIMAMRHYAGQGSWMSDLASAIDYAWENGAHVITVSYNIDGFTNTLVQAIQRADAADVVYLNSAGNNGQNNPPRQQIRNMADNVIFVAASDHDDEKASFSNWGTLVEVAAPGVDIMSTVVGGYANSSGTSMSTPLAAGVVANIRGKFPALSDRETLDLLIQTCDQTVGLANFVTDGRRVNLFNALDGVIPVTTFNSMSVVMGTLSGGDLSSLANSDDVNVEIAAELVADRGQYAAFELVMTSPKTADEARSMKFTVESHTTGTGVVQFVTAYNYTTGRWDNLSSTRLANADNEVEVAVSKKMVAHYVDPTTQEVKIRIQAYAAYKRRGGFPIAFDFMTDHVTAQIN